VVGHVPAGQIMQIKELAAGAAILIAAGAAIWSIDPFATRTASNGSTSNRAGTSLPQQQSEQSPQPLIGVGIAIKPPEASDGKQRIDQGGEIMALVPNSPAAVCGELAVGDLIVAVAQGDAEPKNCRGMEFADVVNLIRGPESSEVRLTVIPADQRVVKRKNDLADSHGAARWEAGRQGSTARRVHRSGGRSRADAV